MALIGDASIAAKPRGNLGRVHMILRIFSTVGEALNFGARRMETIMRVAWLPVVLMLIANMTMVFLLLSVANGRLITFADVQTFKQAEALAGQTIVVGVSMGNIPVLLILGGALVINGILISSFMAPLIRLAGLGERPRPGVLHAPFGMDQIRYLVSSLISFLTVFVFALVPILTASYFVAKHIFAALSKTYARFPDEGSLHTIELATGAEVLAERGQMFFYQLGLPLMAAVPFFVGLWALLVLHFHPNNRAPGSGAPNVSLRSLAILLGLAVLLFAVPPVWMVLNETKINSESFTFGAIYMLGILTVLYVNLRMTTYHAIVVNRRSFAPAGLLSVTRGWNIVRLALILFFVWFVLLIAQYLIASIATPAVLSTVGTIFVTLGSYTKLTSGGDEPIWVLPLWAWFVGVFNVVVYLFWTFFSYGVTAGLYGRLYRESERAA